MEAGSCREGRESGLRRAHVHFLTGALNFVGDKGGAVMDLLRVRRLFAGEKVARFGMTGPGGQPRVTPVPFAVIDDGAEGVVVCSLDVEPRSLAAAAQLRGIPAAPRVSLLADHGASDGTMRWWAQADGVAEVLRRDAGDPRFVRAARVLRERHSRCEAVWQQCVGHRHGWPVTAARSHRAGKRSLAHRALSGGAVARPRSRPIQRVGRRTLHRRIGLASRSEGKPTGGTLAGPNKRG